MRQEHGLTMRQKSVLTARQGPTKQLAVAVMHVNRVTRSTTPDGELIQVMTVIVSTGLRVEYPFSCLILSEHENYPAQNFSKCH